MQEEFQIKYLKSFKFWIISIILLYSALGFIFVPWFLTNKTPLLLKEKIGLHVDIGKAKFNPYLFKLEINDVLLKDLEEYPVVGFKKILIDYTPIWLLEGTFLFESLSIDSPKFYATLKKDGTLNLQNIIPPSNKKDEGKKTNPTKLPAITLQKLNITNGNISFDDLRENKEFHVDLGPYNFQAHDISTKKDALNAHNFSTKINRDGELFWEGGVRLNPLKLYGEINVKNLQLPDFYKYAVPDLDASLSNGLLDFKIPYKIDLTEELKIDINEAEASILNLAFYNKKTDNTLSKIQKISLENFNFAWPAQKIEIDKLEFNNPYVFTLLNKKKELSILEAFRANQKDENTNSQSPNTWSFLLKNTYINNADITLVDNMSAKSITTQLSKTSLHVKGISLDEKRPISFDIDSKLNKATKIISSGKIITKPFKLNSDLEIENFDILEFKSYAKPFIKFKIEDTKIDTKTQVEALMKDELHVNVFSDISVKNLLLKTKEDKKFLEWDKLDISKINFSWPQQKITIGQLNLSNLYVSANINKNKDLSLVKIFEPKIEEKTTSKEKSPAKPWEFLLEDTNVQNAKIDFIDNMGTKPIATNLTQLSLHVKNISLDDKMPINFELDTNLNKSSKLKSSGSVLTKPFKLSSDIVLKDFNAIDYTQYVKPYVNFKIANTKIDTKTHLELTHKNKLNIKIVSDTNIKNLSFKTNDNQRLLDWKKLEINKIKYTHDPMQLSIKNFNIHDPYIKLHIDKKGKTNFSELLVESKDEKKPSKKEEKSEPIKIKIGPMKLVNGTSDFSDFSLPFPFATHIHDLNGDFSTLDFQTTTPSLLNLEGKIDQYGYTHITGKLSPFNIKENANLDVLFKNIDLSSLSPYSGKFVGYKIKSGKLSMDLKYSIDKSKLIGDNKLNIDTLLLGETVESKDAVSLPLGLAIALLKDSEDQIDINMPVSGNMDNPEFSYGSVIWGALGNMITGIVTAPFKFLGSMLGIDGDELKSIDFDKGSFEVISTEHEKLKNLQKILEKRPGIKLTITGGYDETYDVQAIQEQKLSVVIEKELKKIKVDKKATKTDTYGIVLKKLYSEKFTQKVYDEKKKSMSVDKKGKKIELDIVSFNTMLQNELSKEIVVSKEELILLADQRAKNIKTTLVAKYKIDEKRVSIKASKPTEVKRERWIQSELEIAI